MSRPADQLGKSRTSFREAWLAVPPADIHAMRERFNRLRKDLPEGDLSDLHFAVSHLLFIKSDAKTAEPLLKKLEAALAKGVPTVSPVASVSPIASVPKVSKPVEKVVKVEPAKLDPVIPQAPDQPLGVAPTLKPGGPMLGPVKHSAHAELLGAEVKATVAQKFLPKVGAGLGPLPGAAFIEGMEKMLVDSPAVAAHVQKLFGAGKATTLAFDGKAASAFFDPAKNQITMPGKKLAMPGMKAPPPVDTHDLLDGFLFESCNAERAQDFAELERDFAHEMDARPKSFGDFAAAKTRIECEATTKHAQLLFDLFDKGGDLALAGKRNLLTTGGLVLAQAAAGKLEIPNAQAGKPHAVDEEAMREIEAFQKQAKALDIQREAAARLDDVEKEARAEDLARMKAALDATMDQLLRKYQAVLRDGLPMISTDKALGEAVFENFAGSRHNVNVGEPTDKRNLTTRDMYAFEQMENLKVPQVIQIIKTALDKAVPESVKPDVENNWSALEKWMDTTLAKFELNERVPHARQKVVLDIIKKLEEDFPESTGKFDATFAFTPEMKALAEARFEDMKAKNPQAWDEVKERHLPPGKGWGGSLPIPLKEVATSLPAVSVKPDSPQSRDREMLKLLDASPEGAMGLKAIPNAEAGVNTSFKLKAGGAEGRTVALFKPMSPSGGAEKRATCFNKHGAKETREVACSAWNELCGGLGDYPVTVPAKLDGQKGSVMAWRDKAEELSAFDVSEIEAIFAGEDGAAMVSMFADNPEQINEMHPKDGSPAYKVSHDGRRDPGTGEPTIAASELKARCDRSVRAKREARDQLVASADKNAAQDLMALHVGTLQMDAENACNVMFTKADGKMVPFAIDGGLSAPNEVHASDLKAPCWVNWPQAQEPWSDVQTAKFAKVDVGEAAKQLKAHMAKSAVGELEDESVLRMMAATQSLKLAAEAGMTPKMTWSFIQGLEERVVRAKKNAEASAEGGDFLACFTLLARAEIPRFHEAQKKLAGVVMGNTEGFKVKVDAAAEIPKDDEGKQGAKDFLLKNLKLDK